MARYAVAETQREGEPTLRLRDEETGAGAEVWPGCGFNAFALDLPAPEGAARGPRDRGAGPPYPGRDPAPALLVGHPPAVPLPRRHPQRGSTSLRGAGCAWAGKGSRWSPRGAKPPGARATSTASSWTPPGRSPAWRADDGGAEVSASLESDSFPEMLEGFPFPFRLEASYRLDGAGLRLRFQAHNPGPGASPVASGPTPSSASPWARPARPGECLISIPAARRWDGRRLRTTLEGRAGSGGTGAEDEVRPPVSPELDLRTPRPFVEGVFNGLYTDLAREDGWIAASVIDPPTGARR